MNALITFVAIYCAYTYAIAGRWYYRAWRYGEHPATFVFTPFDAGVFAFAPLTATFVLVMGTMTLAGRDVPESRAKWWHRFRGRTPGWRGKPLISITASVIGVLVASLFWDAMKIAAFAVFIAVHEGGHALEARRRGLPIHAFVVIPFLGGGVFMDKEHLVGSPGAAISAAGLVAGLLTTPVFLLAGMPDMARAAVAITLFNLLPFPPFDGNRIFHWQRERMTRSDWGSFQAFLSRSTVFRALWTWTVFAVMVALP